MRLATKGTETENLFEILATKSPVGLYIVQDGKFYYTNPTFQIDTGYRQDELLGKDPLKIVFPEDREMVRENAIKILKGKLTVPYQFRVIHKDGSIRWVIESIASIQYHGRRATLGNVIDITERKQIEEALQAEKNKLQSLIDTMEDHLSIRDRDYNLIYMGEQAKKVWGDHTGEKCYRVFEGQDKVCDGCPAEKTFSDGKSYTSERKTVTPSGEVVFWETRANPIRDAQGRIVACLEIARDITGRKQVTEALQAERNKLQSLIDALEYTLTIQDTEYNIIYQNEPSRIASGGDHVGKKCYRAYEGREKVCEGCPVEEAFKDGKSHTAERRTAISGKVTFWENTASPIRDAGGRIVACLEIARDITEHKQAEDALQAERNKLQSLIDAMEYTLTILDTEHNIIYQNEPARISSGGDHVGEKCYRVYEGRETVCEGCPVKEAFKDGKSHTAERQQVLPSGELSFWENKVNPIRDARGEITSCLEIGLNITGRKKQEEALNLQRAYFKQLFDTSPDAIIMMDTNDTAIQVNKGFEKLFGYSNEEAKGRSLIELIVPEEDAQEASKSLKRILDGEVVRKERLRRRKDGSLVDVSVLAYPIRSNGKLVGTYGIYTDITERKKQEQALADELTRRHILIDQSLDGIVILDVDARVVEANQRFADMLGYTMEEVRELHTWDWDKAFPPEKILEMGRNVDEKGLHLETQHTRKDGSVIDVDISINAAMFGKQKLIFCVCRDITARKKMEEALTAEKNKLQSLIDAMQDDLTIQDRDYNIIYQNEPARINSGDHLGDKCYRAYEGQEGICEDCPVEKAFKDGKPHTSQRRRVMPSGEVTFWENIANPIRDAKGKVVSCLEIGRDITERKKQEQILADELTRRRLLVDQSLDGIVVLDVDAGVVEANQRFAEMLGYTMEEVRELHTWDWDKNFPREKILEMGRKVDEKGLHLETKHTRKDGSVIDVDISINGAMCAGQKLIFCVSRDITERKRAQEALKASEESYRELADSITDVFFAMDEHLRYTYWNKTSEILTGIRAEDALGKSLREVFPDTPWMRNAEKVYRNVLRTHQPQTFVNDTNLDGRHYVFEISAYPSRGGISVFVRDITEREQAEEAIKHAAEEWRRTFDSITDAISIHDRDFKILQANRAFADVFNISPDQIIGKHCYELHKGAKPISGCPHQQTLSTKKPAAAEFYESHLRKYLLESTSPLFNEKGEVVGTVHITRDITEQKRQSERLMMADRLASLGELAAGAAHELNNPLTSIIGFSHLLVEKEVPDDIREDLKLINSEAQRAVSVTQNLLAFARKHTTAKQLNQINNIIEDVLKLRAYELKANNIEVKRQLDPNLPEIMVDYFQMQQVFLNIINNAEYFMTEAHHRGTLNITTKKENSSVRISITDDGPGIPEENLMRIFDPFFTTKEAGKGTGLGLSICHGIVTEHGGQIYARSQLGKGATIFVELPIKRRTRIKSIL